MHVRILDFKIKNKLLVYYQYFNCKFYLLRTLFRFIYIYIYIFFFFFSIILWLFLRKKVMHHVYFIYPYNKYFFILLFSTSQRNRSSKAQIAFLVSFMERNPTFARDIQRTEEIVLQQWDELAQNLNCIGNGRSIEAWQRVSL